MDIGVVDITRLLDESKRGREASAKLRGIVDKWQAQIQEIDGKLRSAQERLQKAGANATLETVFKNQRDMRIFDIELRSLQERQRLDVEANREHMRNQLLADARPVLEKLAQERGLSLVLTTNRGDVAYAADNVDITTELIAALDS